jgi:ABC-type multidrug transport system fused ATPase/permease subunit
VTASTSGEIAYRDELRTVRSILAPFRRQVVLAVVLGLFLAVALISPDLVFGAITNLVRDAENSNLTGAAGRGTARLIAIPRVSSLAIPHRAQRISQGVIMLLRRRVFHRLTKLGELLRPRAPGDIATKVVADLDNVLRFVQGPGFLLVSRCWSRSSPSPRSCCSPPAPGSSSSSWSPS